VRKYGSDYFERGVESGLSIYQNYRWIPEATIPLAATLCEQLGIPEGAQILDYGCAKGFLVKALRLLHREAYGYDISDYAIESAPADVRHYVSTKLYVRGYDWVLAKDVFEHHTHEELLVALEKLRTICRRMWACVPLAENGKYVCPAQDLDATHVLRHDLAWWVAQVSSRGFRVVSATHRMPHVKDSWAAWEKGHGFIVCE